MGEIAFVTWRNGGQNARTTTRAIASKIAQRKSIEEAIAPRARASLDGAISGRRRGSKPTPPVILRFGVDVDLSGAVTTFQPNVATFTFNCVLPEPRNERQDLFLVPSAAKRLGHQRRRRRRTLRRKQRNGPDLPPGRRRHLSERRRLLHRIKPAYSTSART